MFFIRAHGSAFPRSAQGVLFTVSWCIAMILAYARGAELDYQTLEELWGMSQSYAWKLFLKTS